MPKLNTVFVLLFYGSLSALVRQTTVAGEPAVDGMSAVGHLTGCGFPGSYLNSKVILQQPVVTGSVDGATHFPIPVGSTAVYSCEEPYITLGEPTRICRPDFSWSGSTPFCGLNVAMHKPVILPADRFAWLTNDGIISTRARDCYAHSSQAGTTFTWKMDLSDTFQVHSVRILALADFAWSANITVQTVSRTGAIIDVHCGKIDYTGSDQTAAVSLPCRKIVHVRWVRIDFSLGSGNGRLRLCEVNVLAIDALTSDFCPQEASAKSVVHNSCLSFHSHGRATWGGAMQICRKLGGTLMQDITEEEQTYLQGKLQYLHRFQQTDAFYWIGLFRSVNFTTMDDHWVWTNGMSPAMSFWAPNQPDKATSKQFCTGLSGKSGWLWNDFNCESGQGFWICRTNFTSCPIPEQPANGLVTMLDRRLGGLVSYRCEEGFELTGVVSRTCQSSGTWSGLLPRCLVPGTQTMAVSSRPETTPERATTGLVMAYPPITTLASAASHVTGFLTNTSQVNTTNLPSTTTTSTDGTSTTVVDIRVTDSPSSTIAPRVPIMIRSSGVASGRTSTAVAGSGLIGLNQTEGNLKTSPATMLVPFTTITVPLPTTNVPITPIPLTASTSVKSSPPPEHPVASVNTLSPTTQALPNTTTYQTSTDGLSITPEYFAPAITVRPTGPFTRPLASTVTPVSTRTMVSSSTRGFALTLGLGALRCKQVPLLFNGHYTVDMLGPMLVARYSCNSGFNLVGLPFLTCTPDGSWRGMMPLCIPGFGATQALRTTKAKPTWHVETLTTKGTPVGTIPTTEPAVSTPPPISTKAGVTSTVPITVAAIERTKSLGINTRAPSFAVPPLMTATSKDTIPMTPTSTDLARPAIRTTVTAPVAQTDSVDTDLRTTFAGMPVSAVYISPSVRAGYPQTQCPPLPLVEFAEALFQGQKVLFRCLPGYVMVGSNLTTCLPDGTWDSFPECLPVDCGQPPKFLHGMAVLVNGSSTYGSLAAYTCTGHLVTHGIYHRICSETGTWEGPVPECSTDHPALAPAESRQDVQQVSSGLMTIIMGVVGTVGAVTIVVAVALSVRWLRKRETVPVAVSPTMYSLSSEHSPRALMTERTSASMLSSARYVPSTASTQSGYDFSGSLSHASTQTRAKRNVSM